MNEAQLAEHRKERLSAFAAKKYEGSKAALGRALGYRDGAFVGQMLRGERPITEKTVAQVHRLPGGAGWFDVAAASEAPPAAEAATPTPTVADALAIVANYIEGLDIYDKPKVADLMALLARQPSMHAVVAGGLANLKPSAQEPEVTQEAPKAPHYPEQREPGKKDRRNRAHEVKVDYTQRDTYADTDQRIQKQTDLGSPRRDN